MSCACRACTGASHRGAPTQCRSTAAVGAHSVAQTIAPRAGGATLARILAPPTDKGHMHASLHFTSTQTAHAGAPRLHQHGKGEEGFCCALKSNQ